MSQILQNRPKEELKKIIEEFLIAMEYQHTIPINRGAIAVLSHETIENKVHKLLINRLTDFSIPELISIRTMYMEVPKDKPAPVQEKKPDKFKKKSIQ
jgi:hypothetical protein